MKSFLMPASVDRRVYAFRNLRACRWTLHPVMAATLGMRKIAVKLGVATGTVQRVRAEMAV